MQVHYVVDFELRSRGSVDDLFTSTSRSIAAWLTFAAGRELELADLNRGGRLDLRPNRSGVPRTATWDVVTADIATAIRVEVRDEDQPSGSVFVTRVTLGRIEARTSIRISLARESSPTWLSPAPTADLRQPGIVRSLLDNDDVSLSINGQLQDGRYLQVRTDAEVGTLVDALRAASRLPVLLVHTRTLPALAAARTAASKLVGLVRVVTLDYRALEALRTQLPGFAPPRAGARLIWSDPSAPTVAFDETQLNAEDADLIRAHLMRLLAPISVLARGSDTAYRAARRAQIAHQDLDAQARTVAAMTEGTTASQIEALQNELRAARAISDDWQKIATDADQRATEEGQRADLHRSAAEKVQALEAQVEQLTIALHARLNLPEEEPSENDQWAAIPALSTGDVASAQNLFLHLEDAAMGHIVFTDRAATSWKKCRYPFPEEMTTCLVKLAQAATSLYGSSDRTYPHLDIWMRDEFDLKVALQDDTIEKTARLRDFASDDGVSHNRTPHVKVRDHAPPSQVGRIHFAFDPSNLRIIVDHVGLKLY